MNPKKPRNKCRHCELEVPLTTSIYCSNRCQIDFEHNKWVEIWLRGEHDGLRGDTEVSRHIRRWMKETHGEKCSICGWAERNETTDSIPIELDHIDGDYTNNAPSNLRFLCPNHHKLTSNYGSQNRGNGRPYFVQKGYPKNLKSE